MKSIALYSNFKEIKSAPKKMTKKRIIIKIESYMYFDIDNSRVLRKKYTNKRINDYLIKGLSFTENRALQEIDYILSKKKLNLLDAIKRQIAQGRKMMLDDISFSDVEYIHARISCCFKRVKTYGADFTPAPQGSNELLELTLKSIPSQSDNTKQEVQER